MNKSKLTKEMVDDIAERYHNGEQVNKLAEEYGVNRTAITWRLGQRGERKTRRTKVDDELTTISVTIEKNLVDYVKDKYPNVSELFSAFVKHLKTRSSK